MLAPTTPRVLSAASWALETGLCTSKPSVMNAGIEKTTTLYYRPW